MNKNKNEKEKEKEKIKPIKFNSSKFEKAFKNSNSEIIAKAIRDLLIRDKDNGDY